MLDQRQYRDDQPCGDAVAPPCADWDQPRAFLGRRQMSWLKRRLRTLEGALEGDRIADDDDAGQGHRRLVLRVRQLAGLPSAIIDALRGINPWVDQADFDHHGYGLVEASRNGFECTLKRVETIKRRSRAQLPTRGFRYRLERGQKWIKGVNGPPA